MSDESTTDTQRPLYLTLDELWKCTECGTTGKYAILDRAVHHFLYHSPGWLNRSHEAEADQ